MIGVVLGGAVCFVMGIGYQLWIAPAIRRRFGDDTSGSAGRAGSPGNPEKR